MPELGSNENDQQGVDNQLAQQNQDSDSSDDKAASFWASTLSQAGTIASGDNAGQASLDYARSVGRRAAG
ncbi:hypothetical protein ABC733_03535 [Mangrovibacter sp. SLW1]